ncbi:MAG: RNA polymerase sigma factor [Solirubrobacteraceae bacterium]
MGGGALGDPAEHWDWLVIRKRSVSEATRILRDGDDAEEVAQEALARAWRSRRACRTPEAPLAWCLQITRNEALRLIAQRRGHAAGVLLEDEDAITDPLAQCATQDVQIKVDVARALKELDPDERLLITLRYELDWSHKEIAQHLQITESTTRVRLHRAHKRLSTALAETL